MKKKIIIVLILLFVFFAAVVVFLPNILSASLKEALPHISKAINKTITVDDINMSWSGRCDIKKLSIHDEQGDILITDSAVADIAVLPLFSNQVLINEITLVGAHLTIREKEGQLNVSAPGEKEEPSSLPIPEIDEKTQKWIEAIWNTLNDYIKNRDKEGSPQPEEGSEGNEWRMGLDHLHCSDLALIFENEDKSRHEFNSFLTLNGCGSSTLPFLLDLKGPGDFPYSFIVDNSSLELKDLALTNKQLNKFLINGNSELTLSWEKDNRHGSFKIDGISYTVNDKYPPLVDLVLAGKLKGNSKKLTWDVDKDFTKSITNALTNSATEYATNLLEKELENNTNESVKDLKDKAKDKLKGLFK